MPKNCVAIFVNRARRVANARPLAGTSSSSSSSSWSSRHLPSRGAIASSVLSSRSRGRLFLSFLVFFVASVTTTTIRLDARCCLGCHSSSRLSRAPRHIIRACTLQYSTKKNALVFLLVGRAQKRALFVTHVFYTLYSGAKSCVFQKFGRICKRKIPYQKKSPFKKKCLGFRYFFFFRMKEDEKRRHLFLSCIFDATFI